MDPKLAISTGDSCRIVAGGVLDPDLAAVLLAAAFAAVLAAPGLRRALRRAERFCESCGRRVLLGEKTCDCDG